MSKLYTVPTHDRNYDQRTEDAFMLVEDFANFRDIEKYDDPEKRLRFLKAISPEMFLNLARHINARMRHMDPSLHENENDEGATLPLLGTPPPLEKEESFLAGATVIHDFLISSDDDTETTLRAAGMATEALIIWVHPFNDGNGRTSRFVGKFVEDGIVPQTEELIQETTDGKYRQRVYPEGMRVDSWNTMHTLIESGDLLIDEDEIAEIEKTRMPFKDGIAQSLQKLLDDKQLQERILEKSRIKINRFLAQVATKNSS